MANPEPSWEEYESKEDTETESETEEEEEDAENKDDNKNSNYKKEEDNWLSKFFKRGIESSPVEVANPLTKEIKQTEKKDLNIDWKDGSDLEELQRNGFNKTVEKEWDYNNEDDLNLRKQTRINEFEQIVKEELGFDKEDDINLPEPFKRHETQPNEQIEFDYDKDDNINVPDRTKELKPFVKEEQVVQESAAEEISYQGNREEIHIHNKEYNYNNLNNENEHVTAFPQHPIFPGNRDQDDINLETDEEENNDIIDDDGEEEENIKFDHDNYPEEKPISFEEDKPGEIDPEFFEIVDGKDGEPDPYAYAPLDITKGVQIGDKRWKEMMDQILYTSPYEDYVPLETKPPHEAIWEKWERTDFNEGRWFDESEFDDPNMPTDLTSIDMEEIKRLAKLMEEGKPLPYQNY